MRDAADAALERAGSKWGVSPNVKQTALQYRVDIALARGDIEAAHELTDQFRSLDRLNPAISNIYRSIRRVEHLVAGDKGPDLVL